VTRIAVIDSSPLISLTHLDLARELVLFFDIVYVPRSVQLELNRKGKFRYRLNKLYKTGIFVRCMAADATNVRLLRAELDAGEAEALIQGQEKQARFFIGDDRRAREIAEKMGRTPVGTLRLLARLNLEGRALEVGILVQKLRRDLAFRVSDDVVRQAIDIASEPI
jgi:predicted nucleic acid-binding protein